MIPLRGGETGEMYTKVIGGNKNGLRNKCERDRHSKGDIPSWVNCPCGRRQQDLVNLVNHQSPSLGETVLLVGTPTIMCGNSDIPYLR